MSRSLTRAAGMANQCHNVVLDQSGACAAHLETGVRVPFVRRMHGRALGLGLAPPVERWGGILLPCAVRKYKDQAAGWR